MYFLLPNKTKETYDRMFTAYKQLIPVEPRKLLLDFERAAHEAFHAVYPNVPTVGCFFHLRQSVQHKVQELGLKLRYEQDMEFNILVKSLTSLAFVPPDEVSGLFEELVEVFPEEEACDDLLSYYKRTYVQGDIIRHELRNFL